MAPHNRVPTSIFRFFHGVGISVVLRIVLIIGLFLCSAWLYSVPRFTGFFVSEDILVPGGALRVSTFYPPEAGNATLSLVDPSGASVTDAVGFTYRSDTGLERAAFLLPVPMSLPPGNYRLQVTFSCGIAFSRSIDSRAREWPAEEIELTESLTALRRSDEIRMTEEARLLWRLLLFSSPSDVFALSGFEHPLPGARITSEFGTQRRFLNPDGSTRNTVHYGLDLAGTIGTPIHAMAAGEVVLADKRLITGNSVIIRHLPGLYSMYYHLASLTVVRGEMIEKGVGIGTLGSTGFATGPHLHWEVRLAGQPVDPRSLVDDGSFRKIPLAQY